MGGPRVVLCLWSTKFCYIIGIYTKELYMYTKEADAYLVGKMAQRIWEEEWNKGPILQCNWYECLHCLIKSTYS
jgi:hypothetical protein